MSASGWKLFALRSEKTPNLVCKSGDRSSVSVYTHTLYIVCVSVLCAELAALPEEKGPVVSR